MSFWLLFMIGKVEVVFDERTSATILDHILMNTKKDLELECRLAHCLSEAFVIMFFHLPNTGCPNCPEIRREIYFSVIYSVIRSVIKA